MYEGVIRALEGLEPEFKHKLLQQAMDILRTPTRGSTSLKLMEIFPLLSNLLESNNESYKMVVRHFMVEFTDCE